MHGCRVAEDVRPRATADAQAQQPSAALWAAPPHCSASPLHILPSLSPPPQQPYALAWTAISLEVFSLLVALYALTVGPYQHWKSSIVALLAMVTAILVPLTNE